MSVEIQSLGGNEFYVKVPKGKKPEELMEKTIKWLKALGERIFNQTALIEGFRISIAVKEGTNSALHGAVENALDELSWKNGIMWTRRGK